MFYYKRNIGDYHKKAGRLSLLQHGVYNMLIDACYDREQFPTKEDAIDWVWASSSDELQAVEFVLKRFFTLNEDGVYMQNRILEDLELYQAKCAQNKRIANERETKRANDRTKRANKARNVDVLPPNQEPLTINHKPRTKVDICQQVVDEYNLIADKYNLAKVAKLSNGRKTAINARLKEFDIADVLKGLHKIEDSKFLQGNKTDWKVDFDFCMRASSFTKMFEGGYDDVTPKKKTGEDIADFDGYENGTQEGFKIC